MTVRGLEDHRLTVARLSKLGTVAVTFSFQLTGVPLSKLKPLTPTQRNERLRASLKRQLDLLARRFPNAALRSRAPGRGSWTLDGTLPANQIRSLASRPEVSCLSITKIAGRSRRRRPTKDGWFCVWGVVAVQVEGQRSGNVTVEDRLVLVKAFDAQDAVNCLRPEWERYAEPYLNPKGQLVRWKLVGIQDVYEVYDESFSPKGAEVYSRLRTVRMKPEYEWKALRSEPKQRWQRTARSGIRDRARLKRKR